MDPPSPRATPTPHAPPSKLRLLFSYNGHILPRPHDKTLTYIGGDTRLITLTLDHTKTITLQTLIQKIIKTTSFDKTTPFVIKYLLPSEDLDSLVSVSTDEDLQYMIEEYYLNNNENNNNKLRLFLFPRNSDSVIESVKSLGSVLLEGSEKSDEVFVKGLNGRLASCLSFCSDNSLLGLDDDVVKVNGDEVTVKEEKKVVVQDVQSVPSESPEFGSVPDSPVVVVETVKEEANYVAVQAPVKVVNGEVKEEVNYVAVAAPIVEAKVPANGLGANGLGQRVSSGLDMVSLEVNYVAVQAPMVEAKVPAANGLGHRVSSGFDMASPDSVLSDGSLTNPLSRRNPPLIYQDAATQTQYSNSNNNGVTNDQNGRNQMQQQRIYAATQTQYSNNNIYGVTDDQNTRIHDSAYLRSTSTAATTTTTHTDLQHSQVHQQHQFIHTAVPPPQYIHHHPSSYYPIYPPQSQHHGPVSALDKIVYYMPVISPPPNNQVPTPTSLFTTPRTGQPSSKPESPVYRTNSSGASGPQCVQVPSSQHQPKPQYVAYSHIQQGHGIYYAAQPMMPSQSSAQYQTPSSTLPVEGGSHIQTENSMKQQVKTSQP